MNKMTRRFASVLFIAAMSASVWAATKTVTLNVPGMTCPTSNCFESFTCCPESKLRLSMTG